MAAADHHLTLNQTGAKKEKKRAKKKKKKKHARTHTHLPLPSPPTAALLLATAARRCCRGLPLPQQLLLVGLCLP